MHSQNHLYCKPIFYSSFCYNFSSITYLWYFTTEPKLIWLLTLQISTTYQLSMVIYRYMQLPKHAYYFLKCFCPKGKAWADLIFNFSLKSEVNQSHRLKKLMKLDAKWFFRKWSQLPIYLWAIYCSLHWQVKTDYSSLILGWRKTFPSWLLLIMYRNFNGGLFV